MEWMRFPALLDQMEVLLSSARIRKLFEFLDLLVKANFLELSLHASFSPKSLNLDKPFRSPKNLFSIARSLFFLLDRERDLKPMGNLVNCFRKADHRYETPSTPNAIRIDLVSIRSIDRRSFLNQPIPRSFFRSLVRHVVLHMQFLLEPTRDFLYAKENLEIEMFNASSKNESHAKRRLLWIQRR